MSNERDTHFKEFAELLWNELDEKGEFNIDMESKRSHEIVIEIIARRAYDLVLHTANCMDIAWLDRLDMEEIPARIPDMTTFPEVQS